MLNAIKSGEALIHAMRDERALRPNCFDCGLPYGDPGFADLVVPHDMWAKISPTGHEGGLLCPTCMVRAAEKAGLSDVKAIFTSGPFALRARSTQERG